MKSSDKKALVIAIVIILFTAGGIIIYKLIKSNKKKEEDNNELRNRLNESETGRMNLLRDHISKSEKPELIQAEITSLIDYYNKYNTDIAYELVEANQDLKNNNQAESARKIGVVLENILRDEAKKIDNEWYEKHNSGKKNPMLKSLLDWAKGKNVFSEIEYNLGLVVLEFRNKKSHEVNVNNKVPYNKKALAIHAGVELIQKFTVVV